MSIIFFFGTSIMFFAFHWSLLFYLDLSNEKSLLYYMCYMKRNKRDINLIKKVSLD